MSHICNFKFPNNHIKKNKIQVLFDLYISSSYLQNIINFMDLHVIKIKLLRDHLVLFLVFKV